MCAHNINIYTHTHPCTYMHTHTYLCENKNNFLCDFFFTFTIVYFPSKNNGYCHLQLRKCHHSYLQDIIQLLASREAPSASRASYLTCYPGGAEETVVKLTRFSESVKSHLFWVDFRNRPDKCLHLSECASHGTHDLCQAWWLIQLSDAPPLTCLSSKRGKGSSLC